MKIVHNKIIPFKGFACINLFGILFTRKKYLDKFTINHERIHTLQQYGLGYLFFYVLYVLEWLIKTIVYGSWKTAYYKISFELEAYINEENFKYSKHYGWLKYLFK